MKFYIQHEKGWHEVDEFTYKNRKYAVDADGHPLYTDNAIKEVDGTLLFDCAISVRELAQLCRLFNVEPERGTVPGGWCQEPDFIRFCIRGNLSIRDMKVGKSYPGGRKAA